QGDVAEIADRGCDKIEPCGCLGCGEEMAAQRISGARGFPRSFGIYRGVFCAHNADLKGEIAPAPLMAKATLCNERPSRRSHNPFDLVNHSPTICLNPPS